MAVDLVPKLSIGRDIVRQKLARYKDGTLKVQSGIYTACDCLKCQCKFGLKLTTANVVTEPRIFAYGEIDADPDWITEEFQGTFQNGVYKIPIHTEHPYYWVGGPGRLCYYGTTFTDYGPGRIISTYHDYSAYPPTRCSRDLTVYVYMERGDDYGTREWRGDGYLHIGFGNYTIFMCEFKGYDGSPMVLHNQVPYLPGLPAPGVVHSWMENSFPYIGIGGTITMECNPEAESEHPGNKVTDDCSHSITYACWRQWGWTVNCNTDGAYIESGPTLLQTTCADPSTEFGTDALNGYELTGCDHEDGSSEYRSIVSMWNMTATPCGTDASGCSGASMAIPATPSQTVIEAACDTCTGGGLTCSYRFTACYNCETGEWVQEPKWIPHRDNVYCGVKDPFGTDWYQTARPPGVNVGSDIKIVCFERWVSGDRCNQNIAQCLKPDPDFPVSRPTTGAVIDACEGGSGSSGDEIGWELL